MYIKMIDPPWWCPPEALAAATFAKYCDAMTPDCSVQFSGANAALMTASSAGSGPCWRLV